MVKTKKQGIKVIKLTYEALEKIFETYYKLPEDTEIICAWSDSGRDIIKIKVHSKEWDNCTPEGGEYPEMIENRFPHDLIRKDTVSHE